MTGEEVEKILREEACKRAAPYLNGERQPRHSQTYSDRELEVLWNEGYVPAAKHLREAGVPHDKLDAEMAKVRWLLEIVEPGDLVEFPLDFQQELVQELELETSKDPPVSMLRLDERVVKQITQFKVEMFSNESQHAGRPHVRVHLKNGVISVSLDPEPMNLTRGGGLVGEAAALRVIKKNRRKLLKLWQETRPDTQKLKKS